MEEKTGSESPEELSIYNKLYLAIIMKYKSYIEEKENVYAAELPKLILPDNKAVLALAGKVKSEMPHYDYEKNFEVALKTAFEQVSTQIATVTLPVQFWLLPEQTLEIGAGDAFDKANLLCSVLIALGNISSKTIITINDTKRTLGVYCEYKDKIIYADLEKGIKKFSSKEKLLGALGIGKDENLAAYEFNDKMFNNLA